MQEFLEVGKIVTTHGIKGEVKVQPWCDTPELFEELDVLYLDGEEIEILRGRVQKNMAIIKIAGVDTPEDAHALVNKVLWIHRDQLELPEDTYFIADLIGLKVIDADSKEVYGELCEVTSTGANDVYHIKFPDGKFRYAPAIPQVIIKTDLENGVMEIRPLPGLFED